MPTQSLTTIAHEEGKVILPFKEDQFHSFLKSLLGQEQTIQREFHKNFGLTRDDVKHLHSLITQRVAQQNPSHFLGLNAHLFFSDNSSVTFTTIELLCTYNEIKPVQSTRLLLCWTFLVTFADRQAPEKQEIEVTFGDGGEETEEYIVVSPGGRRRKFANGNISLAIRHSARSWGTDIENLVSSYIENIARQEDSLTIFLQRKEGSVGVSVGALFFCGSLLTVFLTCARSAHHMRQRLEQSLQQIAGSNDVAWLKAHVQVLVDIQMQGQFVSKDIQMLIFVTLSLFASVFVGAWVASLIPPPLGGYLLFSRKSEEAFAHRLDKEKNSLRSLTLAFLGTMITGLACNYLYAWLTEPSLPSIH